MTGERNDHGLYDRIYRTVLLIPAGRVATYGQVARITGGCSPRQVGYAMSAVPDSSEVPWHRVLASTGRISVRSTTGEECPAQRGMLEGEGVIFDETGRVDLLVFGWEGPSPAGKGGSSPVIP
jgi:methylated-DNA-protein-cysteine methyltransferase-like protein